MKILTSLSLSLAITGLLFGLTGCATSGGDDGSTGYQNPDPLSQQVQMQEDMSRLTRTLTP